MVSHSHCFDILVFLPQSIVASWCNWLTRRPLKAESSGSIPDDATNQINNLTDSDLCNNHCALKIH